MVEINYFFLKKYMDSIFLTTHHRLLS